jgi:hypothetical protein
MHGRGVTPEGGKGGGFPDAETQLGELFAKARVEFCVLRLLALCPPFPLYLCNDADIPVSSLSRFPRHLYLLRDLERIALQ